ncbi:MAG TPA: ATP-binding cassette domain-containing protein, partial [Luteolibacter sp.]|nr:ATP-binding cassette domain-containing protein [Luteolibacter sp.]
MSQPPEDSGTESKGGRRALLRRSLRRIPGIGRLRSLRPGHDAQVGEVVDAFAAFAMLDGELNPREADLILDLLRSAFPEVDHAWMHRRLQRALRNPKQPAHIALDLKEVYTDTEKLALGLQLFTLVDAAGRSDRNRASFEVFMRRLGRPDYGTAIMREMLGEIIDRDQPPPFERVVFGGPHADVPLPPKAEGHEFRVYRAGDLILVRNTGVQPLWNRGRSVESGCFLRIRERQPLVVPGWTLSHEDMTYFLNLGRTGEAPAIHIESGPQGLSAQRSRSRSSELRITFGLKVRIEVLRETQLQISEGVPLTKGEHVETSHHEGLSNPSGLYVSFNALRRMATRSGRSLKLNNERRSYRVSNDPAEIGRGDLLIGQSLAPKCTLHIRYDASRAQGSLEILHAEGAIQVDGVTCRQQAVLRDGSLIRLSGRQALRCRFIEGFIDEERTLIESLRVENLTHDFNSGSRALDHIDFEVHRGEMLCIIGPSGSGKSTLLAALSGQMEPSRGRVRLNGQSLYEHRRQLVPFIAYMPQEEALNAQLTVREHLRHASAMRRPTLSFAEHERRVDSILAELGLQGIADRKVGSPGEKTLSGGERSRLNLGLDLGSRAEVFLFDEPISGLSSKDSEHVAETLRSLAQEKIVIASLHRPGAQVLRLFDKVLLLDSEGRVAFFGSPARMVEYFRAACGELGISHPGAQGTAPLGADFVFDVLETPLTTLGGANQGAVARRFPSSFWQERFERTSLMSELREPQAPVSRLSQPVGSQRKLPEPPNPGRRIHSMFCVFATHLMRSMLSKLRNRGTIYSTCLEAPLLAALISITLRSSAQGSYSFSSALHIPAFLFLSVTVAMFLGLTNSATEILRDRSTLRRERNCQPGGLSYVLAKFIALGLLASLQCLVYLVIGNHFLEIEGMLLAYWAWMSLTAWAGTALALVVSACVRTERAALTAVPLLLVPQMLLAGALVPYREMNRGLFENARDIREKSGIPVPAYIMPLRYASEGMIVTQAQRNPFEVERIRMQRRIDRMR